MSRARYYISFDNVTWSEFFPTNSPKVSYVREGTEIFLRTRVDKFRIGRTKNITVYDDLYNRFFDPAYFGTDIYYKVSIAGTDKFYFIGPITDGRIDTQNSIFEAEPDPNDDYRSILQQYNKKFQDRDSDGYSAAVFHESATFYYPKRDAGEFTNVDFTTFSSVAGLVQYTNTATANKYATNVLVGLTNNTDQVIVLIKNLVTVGQAPRMKLVDVGNNTKSNEVTLSADGKYVLTQNAAIVGSTYVNLNQTDLAGASSGQFDYEIYYPTSLISGNLLATILNTALNNAVFLNLGIGTPKSTYLWNDALPTGSATNTPNIDTYITANPNNDYVVEGTAIWNDIWLARCDGFTTESEEVNEISLKDIMDMLKIKLRAWWYIDEDGYFRIEHEKYFRDYAVQADLTSATYEPDHPEVDVRVYSYEKESLVNQIKYSEQNEYNEDWLAYPVIFSALETSNETKEVSLGSFSSDVSYLIDYPDDASSKGWVLLRMIPMGTNYLVDMDASTITATNYYRNALLGWAYLMENYYQYFAEAETGTVNTTAHTFTHVKEFLKQDNVKFRMAADLNWKRPFTLLEGTGWVEQAEYELETGMYKVNFGYNPYSITIYVVDSTDVSIQILSSGGEEVII